MSVAHRVVGCNTADSGLEPDKMIQEIGKIILKHIVGPDVFYGSDQAAKEIAKLQSDRIEVIGREYLAELKEEFKNIWSDNQQKQGIGMLDGVKELLRRMEVENGK